MQNVMPSTKTDGSLCLSSLLREHYSALKFQGNDYHLLGIAHSCTHTIMLQF